MTSVCMATYNGIQFIIPQIQSILDQLDDNDELIISDDGSTDGTVDAIRQFNDNRVKLYINSFKDPIKNFGSVLEKATGDYIFLSDQDDIWLPNKVGTCLRLLRNFDVVVTDCRIVDANGIQLYPSYFELMGCGPGIIKNLKTNTYLGCCMCFQKTVLRIALPFPKNIPMHDIWLGFVADMFFKVHFEKIPFILYRRHANNASSTSKKSSYNFLQKLMFRVNTLKFIPLLLVRRSKTSLQKKIFF